VRVTIRPATVRDACYAAANMRKADFDEIDAVIRIDHPAQIACILLSASPDMAFVAYLDGNPVAVFGVAYSQGSHLSSGWAYGTPRMIRAVPAMTRYMLDVMTPELMKRGVRRCEVRTAIDHDLSHGWLAGMGYQREGVAIGYGRNGEDFAVYARVEG
jgi:hypothetical protein